MAGTVYCVHQRGLATYEADWTKEKIKIDYAEETFNVYGMEYWDFREIFRSILFVI